MTATSLRVRSLLLLTLALVLPWTQFYFYPIKNAFTALAAGWAGVMILALAGSAMICLEHALNRFSRSQWVAWLAVILGLGLVLSIHAPGLSSWDDRHIANALAEGKVDGWMSFIYSITRQALFFTVRDIFATGILQYLLVIFMAWRLLALAPTTSRLKHALFCAMIVVVLLAPVTQLVMLTLTRDSLYSLLLTSFLLWMVTRPQVAFSWREMTVLSLALVALGDLRLESRIFLVLLPLLAKVLRVFVWRDVRRYAMTALPLATLAYWGCPPLFGYETADLRYQLTTYVNPLSNILFNEGEQVLTHAQFNTIDRVISVKKMISAYTPYEIEPFHQGATRADFSLSDWHHFQSTALALFWSHRRTFLSNRVRMMRALLNVEQSSSLLPYDELHTHSNTAFAPGQAFFKYADKPDWQPLAYLYFGLYNDFFYDAGEAFTYLCFNLTVPLLLLLLFCFLRRKHPSFALVSLLVMARLGVVFVTVPANHFSYVASVWLVGWILFLVWLMRSGPVMTQDPTEAQEPPTPAL